MIGARVIGTGSSTQSQELLQQLGVDQFVNYKEVSELETVIQDVDLVLDCVGGTALEQSLKVVKREGLVIGITTPDCKDIAQRHGVRGMFFIVSMDVVQLTKITKLLEEGVVRPVIDSVFPLAQATQAWEKAAGGHNHGRMVLSVS
jgi:NADPH:quinone reductase-like Zn-dependent oxidoreductase